MSNIRSLPLPCASKETALEIVESLRKAIEEGEIIGFSAVGIEPDDCTRMWSATTKPVSRLRMMGAMYHLLASFREDV
jgi:hypothetical protein